MNFNFGVMSEYEKQRLRNIEENKKMLASLGLLKTFRPILNPPSKRKQSVPKKVVFIGQREIDRRREGGRIVLTREEIQKH